MLKFKDLKGEHVELTFGPNVHGIQAKHVLFLLKHNEKWLLTKHRTRGIEFPGGKVEKGETIEEAVVREVYEETGVIVSQVSQFAEYVVHSEVAFCKAVFTGQVKEIETNPKLHETEGAVWLTDTELNHFDNLSFYMKDEGMVQLKKWVNAHERKWKD